MLAKLTSRSSASNARTSRPADGGVAALITVDGRGYRDGTRRGIRHDRLVGRGIADLGGERRRRRKICLDVNSHRKILPAHGGYAMERPICIVPSP